MLRTTKSDHANFPAAMAVLIAAFMFSAMFTLPKGAAYELPWFQVVFIRYLGGLLFILPAACKWHRKGNSLKSNFGLLHIGRSIAGIGSVACVIIAASKIPLADVITISFSNGAFVLILAGLILGERVLPRHWLAVIITILGAILVTTGISDNSQTTLIHSAALIALLAAGCMAAEIIVIKFISTREAIPVTLLYVNFLACMLLLIPSLLWGYWQDLSSWWPVVLMGPIAILGQTLNLYGFRRADVALLTPLTYSSILFSAFLGYVIFGEQLTWSTAIGAIIITLGCLVGMGAYNLKLHRSS